MDSILESEAVARGVLEQVTRSLLQRMISNQKEYKLIDLFIFIS